MDKSEIYETNGKIEKNTLRRLSKISFTFDCWTSIANLSYLEHFISIFFEQMANFGFNINSHWISEEFELLTCALSLKLPDHSGK